MSLPTAMCPPSLLALVIILIGLPDVQPQPDRPNLAQCPPCHISRDNLFVNLTVASLRLMDDLLIVPSNRRMYVLVLLPLHDSQGASQCGSLKPAMFESLVGMLHELAMINQDPRVLPEIKLGALVVDTCDSDLRAIANLFELFSNRRTYNDIRVEDLVAVVHYDYPMPVGLNQMLSQMHVPLINLAPTNDYLAPLKLNVGLQPTDKSLQQTFVDILREMHWSLANYVYEDTPFMVNAADTFTSLAHAKGVCTDLNIWMSRWSTIEDAQLVVRRLVLSPAQVVVLQVSADNMLLLMRAMVLENITPGRFMLISGVDVNWLNDQRFIEQFRYMRQGWIQVQPSGIRDDAFTAAFNQLIPGETGLIPPRWFSEYWQQTFNCHLSESTANKYSRACQGSERLHMNTTVFPANSIKMTIRSLAHAISNLRQTECPGVPVSRLTDCLNHNVGEKLVEKMLSASIQYPDEAPTYDLKFNRVGFPEITHDIIALHWDHNEFYTFDRVGDYRLSSEGNNQLWLNKSAVYVWDSRRNHRVPQSVCDYIKCDACRPDGNMSQIENNQIRRYSRAEQIQVAASRQANVVIEATTGSKPSTTWLIVVSSIAGLLALICIVCAIYFRGSLAPCGYLLLIGLLLVCGICVVFVLEADTPSCTIKRLVSGIAWMVVFAPCLVEAISAWSMHFAKIATRPSNCCLLLLSAILILVQLIIAAEWAILDTVNVTGTHLVKLVAEPDTSTNQPFVTYQRICGPVNTFEQQLSMSMIFVCVMGTLSALFAGLAAQQAQSPAHHIGTAVSCAAVIGSWMVWLVCQGAVPYVYRDIVTSLGWCLLWLGQVFLFDVSLILCGLFLRRACDTSAKHTHVGHVALTHHTLQHTKHIDENAYEVNTLRNRKALPEKDKDDMSISLGRTSDGKLTIEVNKVSEDELKEREKRAALALRESREYDEVMPSPKYNPTPSPPPKAASKPSTEKEQHVQKIHL